VLAEFDAALAGMRERAARERGRVSIALLPLLAADRLPQACWPGLTCRIYLVRRRDRGLSVAAQGFYDWVMARRPTSTKPATRRSAGLSCRRAGA
jgi:hypothetical protein